MPWKITVYPPSPGDLLRVVEIPPRGVAGVDPFSRTLKLLESGDAAEGEFAFVKAYQAQFPIRTLCRVLGLSTSA